MNYSRKQSSPLIAIIEAYTTYAQLSLFLATSTNDKQSMRVNSTTTRPPTLGTVFLIDQCSNVRLNAARYLQV